MIGSAAARTFGLTLSLKAWAAVAIGALAIACLLAAAGYAFGLGEGRAAATKEAAAEMARHIEEDREKEREQARLLAEANKKNRDLELQHEQRVSDLRAEFAQQQAEAKARDDRTIADLRNGNERLRLQVANCSAGPRAADGTSGGANEGGTAELAPETAATLWGIVADGDAAIRQLTQLQEWARSAVQTCNATTEKQQ